jgi:hypothetical protein
MTRNSISLLKKCATAGLPSSVERIPCENTAGQAQWCPGISICLKVSYAALKGRPIIQPRATPWECCKRLKNQQLCHVSAQRANSLFFEMDRGKPLGRWPDFFIGRHHILKFRSPGRCPGLNKLLGLRPVGNSLFHLRVPNSTHFKIPDTIGTSQQWHT